MICHDPSSPALDAPESPGRALVLLRASYVQAIGPTRDLEDRLAGVLEQVRGAPGSMNRALTAFGLMTVLGAPEEQAVQAATAIEYWHAASLLLDDLPCMDNASDRRGLRCAHLSYGEAPAILGALAFVNKAYRIAWDAIAAAPLAVRKPASRLLDECLGAAGVLNGQAMDLAFARGERTARQVLRIADDKTGTLLRLSLQWPALLAGVSDLPRQRALRRLARAWGRAYQILDDFKDVRLLENSAGKTAGRDSLLGRPNLVIALGVALARETLLSELRNAATAIHVLMREVEAASFLLAQHRVFETQAARLLDADRLSA